MRQTASLSDWTSVRAPPLPRAHSRILTLALSVVFLIQVIAYLTFTTDDAFISFRYAHNIATGHGLVYNLGERVEGFSNPLWTLLLAIPARLGVERYPFGLLIVAKALGASAGLAAVLAVWRIAALLRPEQPYAALVAPVFLACCGGFAAWSVGGLETPLLALFYALFAWSVLRGELDEPTRTAPWSAVWLFLAAITRPEPALCAVVLPLWYVLDGRRWRAALRWLLWFGALYAAFLAVRWCYYGSLLPNTYYAKLNVGDQRVSSVLLGTAYILFSTVGLGTLPAWLSVAALGMRRKCGRSVTFLLLYLAVIALSVAYLGPDWMPLYRFCVPMLPILAVLFGEAVLSASITGRVRAAVVTSALLSALLCPALVLNGQPWSATSSGFADRSLVLFRGYIEAGQWLRDHARPGQLVALGEAGVIPYESGVEVLDMFGLVDTHISHLVGTHFGKFDVNYVLDRDPAYVVLAHVMYGLNGERSSIHLYAMDLWADPRFGARYVQVRQFSEVGDGQPYLVPYERRDLLGSPRD